MALILYADDIVVSYFKLCTISFCHISTDWPQYTSEVQIWSVYLPADSWGQVLHNEPVLGTHRRGVPTGKQDMTKPLWRQTVSAMSLHQVIVMHACVSTDTACDLWNASTEQSFVLTLPTTVLGASAVAGWEAAATGASTTPPSQTHTSMLNSHPTRKHKF